MGLTLRDRSAKGCLRSLEGECWIDRESSGCEFRDARLGDRFRKLLTQIGSAMGQSIPLVCQDWANTKAAYRFFSNDRVSEAEMVPSGKWLEFGVAHSRVKMKVSFQAARSIG